MKLRSILLSGCVAGALGGALVLAGAPSVLALQSRGDQGAVVRSFRSVLNRDPHPYELRRYARLMNDYEWTEQDVRRDLAERSDYRRYSAGSTFDTNAIITRGYQDILGRDPDPAGIRSYRQHIIEEGWSEQDVREALRQSPEYRSATRRNTSADGIIRRAYRDVLNREPDPGGLDTYRRAILDDGWDEQDVRQVLRRSDERRGQRTGEPGARQQGNRQQGDRQQGDRQQGDRQQGDRQQGTRQQGTREPAARGEGNANQLVRNAYLAVLNREPDATGLRDYGARVRQDNWSQADIEKALRDSPEYRNRNR